ncbi:MAG: hypothetical protein CL910_04605 [Deltaproteobacteria bacterium]|nr:hypothetical protein [Deltaproteobacteria bacterium]
MRQGGWFQALLAAVLVTNTALLLILVLQQHNREERAIRQSAQFRELAESSDRVRAELRKLRREIGAGDLSGLGAGDGTPADSQRSYLRPDLPNFLQPNDFEEVPRDAENTEGTLTLFFSPSDPKGFNGMIENAADLSVLESYTSDGLAGRMAFTDPDRWTPALAERVEVTDEGKTFTIYLKRGVKWHPADAVDLSDPRYAWLAKDHEVTAHDFAFYFEILKNPQVQNGFMKNYYEDLESWEVIDDHTLVVRWSKRIFLSISATLGVPPLPEFLYAYDEEGNRFPDETLGLNFNQHWYNHKGIVGCGPFRFASYSPGERVVLERFEDYHGELPALRQMVFEIVGDQNVQFLKLRSGKHDFGYLLASAYRDHVQPHVEDPSLPVDSSNPFAGPEMEAARKLTPGYFYLGWNADKPIFADKRVRRAMTHAFDRTRIIENIFVGLGELTTGPFVPGSPYEAPEIEAWPFDLERAKALLAEAGWTDSDGDGLVDKDLDPEDRETERSPFEFKFLIYASRKEMDALANVYKEDLLKVGVRMKIEKAEWSLMQKRMDERDFEAFTGGWASPWDVDLYQIWHSSQADLPKGSNKVGFRNAEADEIIEALRESLDTAERVELARRFHRIVHEEQPYTFFYVRERYYTWWDRVRRVVFPKTRPLVRAASWWVAAEG